MTGVYYFTNDGRWRSNNGGGIHILVTVMVEDGIDSSTTNYDSFKGVLNDHSVANVDSYVVC